MLVYAVVGTAPLWLDSLPLIHRVHFPTTTGRPSVAVESVWSATSSLQ